MKLLLQRVAEASVEVDGEIVGRIEKGLLVFAGFERHDTEAELKKLAHKLVNYRVFPDEQGKMNHNLQQAGGQLLVVSQFTLAAETSKGLRPGFSTAAEPGQGQELYNQFLGLLQQMGQNIETGIYGADMKVRLLNDGPVTFLLEA